MRSSWFTKDSQLTAMGIFFGFYCDLLPLLCTIPMIGNTESKDKKPSSPDFNQLLQDARELVLQCRAAPSLVTGMYDELMLPPVQRGLSQLEQASSALASSASVVGGPSSRGYQKCRFYILSFCSGALLAAKGFDQNRLVEQLTRLADLPPSRLELAPSSAAAALDETDLDAFLESRFETRVLGVVEALQERVREESERLIQASKDANWDRLKRLYLDRRQLVISDPQQQQQKATETINSQLEMRLKRRAKPVVPGAGAKTERFLSAVHRLNNARLSDAAFAPAQIFRALALQEEPGAEPNVLADCWESLALITGEPEMDTETNVFVAPRRPSASGYQEDKPAWSKQLIAGSRTFLERMFARYMDATVAQYPREAQLGGKPSPADRARAYATLRAQRMAPSDTARLDVVPHGDTTVPYWLVIWALLRSGRPAEALDYASSPSVAAFMERAEPAFLSYFRAHQSGGLTGVLLAQLRSDYAQRASVPLAHDPYKLAVYKVLGRCDLARKSLPDVVQTSEDYLWLQLALLTTEPEQQGPQSYTLSELQSTVLAYGPGHFDPKGAAPLRYFHILCLVGLFEQAIAFLHTTPYQLEAIHAAIALAYHGILRVADEPTSNAWDLLITKNGKSQLNFGMLINQYSKLITTSYDVLSGLQYIFLLTLVTWCPAYTTACRQLVRDLVLEHTGDAAALLGDVKQDGSVQPGFLAKHAHLLGLATNDNSAFMSEITVKAAERCDREGRLSDALQLYNLAGEYSRVLQLLMRRLSSAISLAYQADDLASLAATTDAILQYYRGQERIRMAIPSAALEATETLLRLSELRKAVEESNWHAAAAVLESSQSISALVPMDSVDSMAISRAAERLRTPAALPEPLASVLPESLLLIMRALHGRFQALREYAFVDPGRQSELDRIRKQARALMLLVGLLRVRIQPEICAQLTRLDILMN